MVNRKVALVIPTYNAGDVFYNLLLEISLQTVQASCKLLIDSSSTDTTVKIAKDFGWKIEIIGKSSFSHGGTRQYALELLPADIDVVIFMTQDVRLLNGKCFESLISAFDDCEVGAAYGRQIGHDGASIYAVTDRNFNYPPVSIIKSMESIGTYGIKTAFLSNSFAAYRMNDLRRVGGFPVVDICEDIYTSGKMLLSGRKIAYVAHAVVKHSHELDLLNLWKRYRAMGCFYRENQWLQDSFGTANKEGWKLLKYQMSMCISRRKFAKIFKFLFIDLVKYVAFRCVL
ncbi:glycosyltransferase [Anaerovibrio slackiae]|uniref:glycosyltransferase n=1 Tax=Anaerovibrio slackiae TaxID=2652309 RepID=UPI003F144419